MIGCQTTDKKHKVNVKHRDHKARTCPLLSGTLYSPCAPHDFWVSICLSLTLLLQHSSLKEELSFIFLAPPLSLLHTLSDSNQTSNYSSAWDWGCVCVWVCVRVCEYMSWLLFWTQPNGIRFLLMPVTPQPGMSSCLQAYFLSAAER